MIAVFIDTNIFEKLGFNFDARNQILLNYKQIIKTKKVENVIISVIDEEIKSHINKLIDEDKQKIKKHCKWIYSNLDDNTINQNITKRLKDYALFKEKTNSKQIDLKNINPEIVLKKYFKVELPFEKSKPKEFKDAFFLEAVYKYAETNVEYSGYIIVSNDNGIRKSIEVCDNHKIKCANSIQELVDMIINYNAQMKTQLKDYLCKYNFDSQLNKKYSVSSSGIEEEEIDIENVETNGVFGLDVINVLPNKITVVCDLGVCLIGNFSCLDYDNSYYSSEENDYIYKEYKKRKWIGFICQTVIDIYKENDKYVKADIVDLPEIDIDYDSFKSIEDYLKEERE